MSFWDVTDGIGSVHSGMTMNVTFNAMFWCLFTLLGGDRSEKHRLALI